MNALRALVVSFAALALALPAQAAPKGELVFSTGLHAHEIEPLVRGVLAQGLQVAAFATCFLALDDDQTCIEISGRVRAELEAG